MKLSELKTGQKAVIVKVIGHGGFRKRIVEMGFIKGQTVEVLLNAPLQDPVKYKVMGYEVSLRRQEADMIEVSGSTQDDDGTDSDSAAVESLQEPAAFRDASKHSSEITVALVGNPNCGKTVEFS